MILERKRNLVSVVSAGLLLGGLLLVGCATRPFDARRGISSGREIAGVMDSIDLRTPSSPANELGKPMAFGITEDRKIVALDLAGKEAVWEQPAERFVSRIIVGHRNVYYVADRETIVARSVRTGKRVWSIKEDLGETKEIIGIAASGDRVFVVVGQKWRDDIRVFDSRLTAIDGTTGRIRWVRKSPGRLGAPAALGDYVFVPYRQMHVSVLDFTHGRERARTRIPGEFFNFVRTTPSGVFFGSDKGIVRFNSRAATSKLENADFFNLRFSMEGEEAEVAGDDKTAAGLRILYHWDGYEPLMLNYTVYDRNRLLWRGGEGAEFENNHAVLVFFRYFFGFNTEAGNLSWVHVHSGDEVMAAEHVDSRIIYVTDTGRIKLLDPKSGDRLWKHDFGIRLRGATFDVEGAALEGERRPAEPIERALGKILFDPDMRFAAAKLFAIRQLKGVRGRRVSEVLLDIIADQKLPENIREMAETVLVNRPSEESIPLYLNALERDYDYLTGERTDFVGSVARALASMKVKKAVPAIARHLHEPHTPVSALRDIVDALAAIGGPDVVRPLRQFLLDYRADPGFRENIGILNRAAETVLENGGVTERQLLVFIAEDAASLSPLREFIRQRLDGRGGKGAL